MALLNGRERRRALGGFRSEGRGTMRTKDRYRIHGNLSSLYSIARQYIRLATKHYTIPPSSHNLLPVPPIRLRLPVHAAPWAKEK